MVSAGDWEREQEQETLYVLQNKSLMEQIERSRKTHRENGRLARSGARLGSFDSISMM